MSLAMGEDVRFVQEDATRGGRAWATVPRGVWALVLVLVTVLLPVGGARAIGEAVVDGRISFLTNINYSQRIGTMRLNGADVHISSIKASNDEFFGNNTPRWSADGGRVVFLTNSGGLTSHVRTMRADGGDLIDHGTIPADTGIAWTPEGNVAWIDADGLWEASLGSLDAATLVASGLQGSGLAYSPDGAKIAYQLYSGADASYHVWTADRDGTNAVQLTTGSPEQFEPAWAPDSTSLVYRSGGFGGGPVQLHSISANGTGDTQLTSDGKNYGATYSPDGTKIAFTSTRSKGVWVMNADGSDQRQAAVGNFWAIDWQPAHALLTVSTSQLVFGGRATVTAGTPGAQTTGILSIYRVRAGTDALVKIAQAAPNEQGRLRVTFEPKSTATYLAYWSGDGVAPYGWADVVSIKVQVKLTGKMQGGYATRNGARLYHYTASCTGSAKGCPAVAFTLAPTHPGEKLIVVWEIFKDGSWRLADHRAWKLRNGRLVSLVWIYGSRSVVGRSFRVMASFHGDVDHQGAKTRWLRFRVTN